MMSSENHKMLPAQEDLAVLTRVYPQGLAEVIPDSCGMPTIRKGKWIIGTGLALMLLMPISMLSDSGIFTLAALILPFVPMVVGSILVFSGKEERGEFYACYLVGFPKSALVKASRSPELDELSRKYMVACLNKNYPGWSFEGG